MASLCCRRDPCGVVCLILTYFSVFYADYVVVQYVLIPAYSGSIWCSLHGSAFNVILLLLLACHSKAVFSDPGVVPLPDTALDFSDLRSQSSRMSDRGCEGWTVCSRCETYRPPRAHHCRVCQRCIRRMDHHCPWINNCVGELNQKYFIQFLFYTGVASVYATLLVVSAWVWRIRSERDGGGDEGGDDAPGKHLIVYVPFQVANSPACCFLTCVCALQRALHHPAGGVGALRCLRPGHLFRSVGVHHRRRNAHRADEEQAAADEGTRLVVVVLAAATSPRHAQAQAGAAAGGFRTRFRVVLAPSTLLWRPVGRRRGLLGPA
ncbi:zf-DHHC domain-containing protein isoform X1 [Hippocampus zosterae]|uniref:zf-DHHC domain-containing protein isoform X1 n=1 Tax=Hippocampus zosterae TaxID=109293 RepID=UPI00223E00E0|nr:zf-DHHC domain-containing protein isoform X1 [Hippocampus zosterae]